MKESTLMGIGLAGIILLFVAAMCFPLLTIWAINTLLFPIFSIPYSWSTWFAMIVIQWIISGCIVYQLKQIKEKL